MSERDVFENIREEDRILFNDRKVPLTVEAVDENRLHVEGPQGGEYIVFPAENDPEVILVANKGSREYASKVEDLRKVGKWVEKEERLWKHSGSGRKVELVRNDAGFWTIETELDIDLPKYGFSDLETAEEQAEKLMEDNPEG